MGTGSITYRFASIVFLPLLKRSLVMPTVGVVYAPPLLCALLAVSLIDLLVFSCNSTSFDEAAGFMIEWFILVSSDDVGSTKS